MNLYIVILWISTQLCGSKQSGIRQTHDSIKRYPHEAMERLYKVFGISQIPEHLHHGTPPEYMIELFKSVAYDDGISKKSAPYNANTVRGIPDRALHQQIQYVFNLSHVESTDILQAEFHLFKVASSLPGSEARPPRRHLVELKLYQVVDPDQPDNAARQRLIQGRRVSVHSRGWEIFSVRDTVIQWVNDSSTNHGFLVESKAIHDADSDNRVQHLKFAQRAEHHNSKQPLLVIFASEKLNLLDLKDNKNQPGDNTDLSEEQDDEIPDIPNLDIKSAQNNNNSKTVPQTNGDSLSKLRRDYVRFLNEEHRAEHGVYPPHQRSMNTMSPELHRRLTSGHLQPQRDAKPKRRSRQKRGALNNKVAKRRKKTCSLHELYVDFEEIGWSGWIISPKGYNAFHCKGACQFPLGQNQQPTNHATVQSIVNAFRAGGRDVGTPCCVPNKLFSISLLYFDDQENVILKQYDDMVAASCGCH